jgi:hypothetical protein
LRNLHRFDLTDLLCEFAGLGRPFGSRFREERRKPLSLELIISARALAQ